MRYTIRALRRDAGVSLFVILIAALGIGASSTVFSVVNALLLRPLPFGDPGALVWIANRDTGGLSGQTTQVGHMLDLREEATSLTAIAGYFAFYGVGDNLMSGSGEPERLSGVPVSDDFFEVLAIGASAAEVQRQIIAQTLWLTAIGLAAGAADAWALARGLSVLLYEVTPADPAAFAGMLLVLLAVALLAGYLPARRASRIDPMSALRAE